MQYFPQAGVFRFAEQRSHFPILVLVSAVEQDADDGRDGAVVPHRMVDLLLDQRIQQRAASFVAVVHVRPMQNALNDSEYVSSLDAPVHRFRGVHSVLEQQVQDVVVLARATGILGYGQSVLGVRGVDMGHRVRQTLVPFGIRSASFDEVLDLEKVVVANGKGQFALHGAATVDSEYVTHRCCRELFRPRNFRMFSLCSAHRHQGLRDERVHACRFSRTGVRVVRP